MTSPGDSVIAAVPGEKLEGSRQGSGELGRNSRDDFTRLCLVPVGHGRGQCDERMQHWNPSSRPLLCQRQNLAISEVSNRILAEA